MNASTRWTLKTLPALCFFLLIFSGCSLATAADPLAADHGMVVSASKHASGAGIEIMQAGGNAFDAAATVGFVLAVTFPEAGNLGGGGFMVARKANGQNLSLDFREKAPARARRDMFLDWHGEADPELSLRSPLASGVPGTVDGLLSMWKDHGSGRISRHDLLAPAVRLAEDGFIVSAYLADAFNESASIFAKDPAAAKIFNRSDGRPWQEGDTLVQWDLARTLHLIAARGRDAFYTGSIASLIARQNSRSGGLITREDLETYNSVYRDPVIGNFRDYEIISMGPPSSGGVLLIQMLNMLQALGDWQLKDMRAAGSGWRAAYVHLLTEVQRRAYADRAQHLGDPEFWDGPISELTSLQYAEERAKSIRLDFRATPSSEVAAGIPLANESQETTHYSVVDAERNAVSVTVTLNGKFGSGIVIDGAGLLMNNEMDDFSSKPGVPNKYGVIGGEANAIEPGKRMLSSMTPTIAVQNGKSVMVLGSPGGATIITTVLQVFLNVAWRGMNIQDAVSAPRHHSQWLPDYIDYEEGALSASMRESLMDMGHTIAESTRVLGAANCILIDEEKIYGAPDPRRQSAAVGY